MPGHENSDGWGLKETGWSTAIINWSTREMTLREAMLGTDGCRASCWSVGLDGGAFWNSPETGIHPDISDLTSGDP